MRQRATVVGVWCLALAAAIDDVRTVARPIWPGGPHRGGLLSGSGRLLCCCESWWGKVGRLESVGVVWWWSFKYATRSWNNFQPSHLFLFRISRLGKQTSGSVHEKRSFDELLDYIHERSR